MGDASIGARYVDNGASVGGVSVQGHRKRWCVSFDGNILVSQDWRFGNVFGLRLAAKTRSFCIFARVPRRPLRAIVFEGIPMSLSSIWRYVKARGNRNRQPSFGNCRTYILLELGGTLAT